MKNREKSNNHPFIGIISDTHGLIRPEALKVLMGAEIIIHAGDIVARKVIDRLQEIALVYAVKGNMDAPAAWSDDYHEYEIVEYGKWLFCVLHDLDNLDIDLQAAGFHAVIHGHTHMPSIYDRNGVMYFNPGSAGYKREGKPVTVGRIYFDDGELRGEIIEL